MVTIYVQPKSLLRAIMVLKHFIAHGLFYSFVVTGYLLILMITTSPRVWGYSDFPQATKNKVQPQTSNEKKLAVVVALPWFLFTLGFPVYSTLCLKAKLSNEISFWTAFINFVVLFGLATVGDLVILDWLIISKLTPKFVIMPGSEKEDYKDFSHHYKGHAKATILLIPILMSIAGLISTF